MTKSRSRARWKKRQKSRIAKAQGDPEIYDRIDGSGVTLASIKWARGLAVLTMPNGESFHYGDLDLAKQAAGKRIERERAAP